VNLSLTTHAIGGLSRNDFVLAAELQAVIRPPSET
jgi:pterin-4a-carbinolamine dehydratase